ncbi:mycothiol biosynthesis acetyltransferase [Aeromicrobium marinum DSM 15272]|uniref:Mycothiol acetyltransferase n=1 Tax=Aeromicrobium marinum DSM 15272 TaxID=585531 RepID=E2SBR9_9ACTN|nr:mycothiol synthase [Aeromicrobium marinum]EFQ83205.1 mycothiol biosynthesis acetyltransferase [Aeromicrobium marinum DSM 15272]
MSLLDLAASVAAHDGVDPLNEASRLALDAGDPPRVDHRIEVGGRLVAAAFSAGEAPVEILVAPTHRRGGLGGRLLDLCRTDGETGFWAHGDLVPARALAGSRGLSAGRTLLVLRLRMPQAPARETVPDGVTLRTFEDADAEAVVTVNARAFADHPEQGAMDLADFRRRAAADWFDPAGLFVAERDGAVVGFHWTKVEPAPDGELLGEVYVVGVDPSEHGKGLGTALTARGLRHLFESGVRVVDLYVEGDNEAALTVYRRLGFDEHARDTLYRAP